MPDVDPLYGRIFGSSRRHELAKDSDFCTNYKKRFLVKQSIQNLQTN